MQATLLDLVTGEHATVEQYRHLEICARCARRLQALRSTFDLLDEWRAPRDVSPFFMPRLLAHLRELSVAPLISHRRFAAWALGSCAVLGLLMTTVQVGDNVVSREVPQKGTAVLDLQVLDRDYDLLLEADFLDVASRTQPSAVSRQGAGVINPVKYVLFATGLFLLAFVIYEVVPVLLLLTGKSKAYRLWVGSQGRNVEPIHRRTAEALRSRLHRKEVSSGSSGETDTHRATKHVADPTDGTAHLR